MIPKNDWTFNERNIELMATNGPNWYMDQVCGLVGNTITVSRWRTRSEIPIPISLFNKVC